MKLYRKAGLTGSFSWILDVEKKLYGHRTDQVMKTDVKELENGYEVTIDLIKAEFKHGILTLFVPKKEAKPAVEQKNTISIEG